MDKIFKTKFKKEIIYIHNLNFDGFLIIEALTLNKIKFEIFCNNLNIYNITVKFNDKVIIFKCSYKILPMSLEKIAHLFKIGNKMTFPYNFVNKNNLNYIGDVPHKSYFNSNEDYELYNKTQNNFSMQEYTVLYCKNDVLITVNFLNNIKTILKDFKINISTINSAPSLALKIFDKVFNKNKIKLSYNSTIDKIARNSYFGGRCEVYGNPYENEQIFHFDFSGMYAQCMKEKFPYGKYKINNNVSEIKEPGIYWIEYESKDILIPVLPHHRLKDHKLMFCNGKFTGAFWYEEILLFIEKGGVVNKILHSLTFEKYDYVFNEYVEFFTDLRNKSQSYNTFGKLMINSMYGRLGMRNIDKYSFIEHLENINKIKNKIDIISLKELNEVVLIEAELNHKLEKLLNLKRKKSKNNIVLASCITSKARIKLYKAQEEVIKNKGRMLYSDTDSIFASFNKDVLGETHGEIYWDPNKNTTKIKEAMFFSAKSYALKYYNDEYDIKLKGYNQKNINFDEIKKYFNEKEKLSIKNYKFLNKKNLKLGYYETIKQFDLNFYDKRIFIDSRYNTKPFFYENYEYK
jgi:hypothetical protein